MKKLFTFMGLLAAVAVNAKETTVWEGSEPISWNAEITGTQFETPANTFTGLAEGDTIKVTTTVTTGYSDPQYVLTYKAGSEWTWTDLTTTVSDDGTITYIVESADIATYITERNLIFRGQAYTITKIVVASPEAEPSETYDLMALSMNSIWPKDGESGVTTGTSFADGVLTMGTYANDESKWCGAGWWLAQWDGDKQENVPVDFSAYDKLIITFASATTSNGGVSVKYNSGDAGWVGFEAEATAVEVELDATRKSELMEVTIQGPQGAVYTLSQACFATKEVVSGIAAAAVGVRQSSAIYNLAGQRLSKPAKGLYIQNGKKYIAQ